MTVPIFVINLKEDKDRWRNIFGQINAFGLPFSRFDAYRGEYVPQPWKEQFFPKTKRAVLSHPTLTSGEIGCYASHLACMNMLLEGNHPAAIILEDDIIIDPRLPDIISNIEKIPENWDIVHLSGQPKSSFFQLSNFTPDFELIKFSRIPTGALGYIVSRSGAQKFISNKQNIVRRFPNDIEVRNAHIRRLNVYGCLPPPVSHNLNFRSTIDLVSEKKREYGTHRLSLSMLIKRIRFNITNLTFKLWIKCFLWNICIHIFRRIYKKNLSVNILRVENKSRLSSGRYK